MSEALSEAAARIAARAERDTVRLVDVSSPSGDVPGAEACFDICRELAAPDASAERIPCSSPGHADDLLLSCRGTGTARILLLGHVDTVVSHPDHRPAERSGDLLTGPGTVDMKGGVVLALGVQRELATRPEAFAELTALLVCDEEWRTAPFTHGRRFTDWDACLCFEAGELGPGGEDAVIVRRKAAGTVRVHAHGRAAHAGAAPEQGRNALTALARIAARVEELHDPDGPDALTAVPTVIHCGDAFNVIPAGGELICDLRADSLGALERAMASLPAEEQGVRLDVGAMRMWPGMDTGASADDLLARAGELLGRPLLGRSRGGASDASHMAAAVRCAVDGLGPLGGDAHHPDEHLDAASLQRRAEVALAVANAALPSA